MLEEGERESFASPPSGPAVLKTNVNFGSAIPRSGFEFDRAAMIDVRTGDRMPGEAAILDVFEQLSVPFQRAPERRRSDPVRSPIVKAAHLLQVLHEARQILNLLPEAVDIFWRFVYGHGFRDTDIAEASVVDATVDQQTSASGKPRAHTRSQPRSLHEPECEPGSSQGAASEQRCPTGTVRTCTVATSLCSRHERSAFRHTYPPPSSKKIPTAV